MRSAQARFAMTSSSPTCYAMRDWGLRRRRWMKLARGHRSFSARLLLSLRPAGGGVTSRDYAVTLRRATAGHRR
jgi:hypothetical protein